MNITSQLAQYMSVRRSLGYDLRTDERVLRRFARFADQENASHVDAALFLAKKVAEGSEQHIFDMIDVLKAGAMR